MEVLINIKISLIKQKSGAYRRMVNYSKNVEKMENEESCEVIENKKQLTIVNSVNHKSKKKRRRRKQK